ncbi:hypothetical protein ACVW0I_008394 [Bradyrhizobium sp. LM6.11]
MGEPALRGCFEPRGLFSCELPGCLRDQAGQIKPQRSPDEQARIKGGLLDAGRLQPCRKRAPRTLDAVSGFEIGRQWNHPAWYRG